jgi:hypothetical protein
VLPQPFSGLGAQPSRRVAVTIALCDAFPALLRSWTRIQKIDVRLALPDDVAARFYFRVPRSSSQSIHHDVVVVGALFDPQYGLALSKSKRSVASAGA